MKKKIILIVIGVLFINTCVQSQPKDKDLQEFVTSLSSTNVKLRGKLMLFGEYKGNLSPLTYKDYIKLSEKNESESNKGITKLIKRSNKQFFVSDSTSFIIAIYSKSLNAIICDDASTAFTDSILILQKNVSVPDLAQFAIKTKIKVKKKLQQVTD